MIYLLGGPLDWRAGIGLLGRLSSTRVSPVERVTRGGSRGANLAASRIAEEVAP